MCKCRATPCSTRVIQSPKLAVQHFKFPCIFIKSSRLFVFSIHPYHLRKTPWPIVMFEMQQVKLDLESTVKNSSVKDNNENDEKIALRQLPVGFLLLRSSWQNDFYQNGEYLNESLWMSLVPPNHDLIQNVRKPKPSKTIKTIKTIKVNNHLFHPCKHPPIVPESVQCLSHLACR